MSISNHPRLTGLHFLLTYQCTFECDHCFAWGSPWQSGTFSLARIRQALEQAEQLGTISEIYFEGGEPFLYYATLVKAVEEAHQRGFNVGIVSNSYWAITFEDALEWLRPFAGLITGLTVSSDLYHYNEPQSQQARNAAAAAEVLGIQLGTICVAQPEALEARATLGMLPPNEPDEGSNIMYRGRAVEKLVPRARLHPWQYFRECPYEELRSPGRVHLDPLGYLHICQGICLGNLFDRPLQEIWEGYDPEGHPITGALLDGGPVELVKRYQLSHDEHYADACHLCYEARRVLRPQFPEYLAPNQMYGEF
jgi:MoaA/NifB/PqqE/SkfB family radical SAM enzyme